MKFDYKIAVSVLVVGTLFSLILWSTKYDPAMSTGQLIDKLNSYHTVVYIYGTDYESAQQLNEFAPYSNLLNIVDCEKEKELCQNEQINDYPQITLTDIGIDLVGLQTRQDLNNLLQQIEIW